MPTEDAARWNLRYQSEPRNFFNQPQKLLLEHTDLLPTHGLALDIAMGFGGNAGYLIRNGLRVIGVDISHIAVSRAMTEIRTLMGVVADLEYFHIPQNTFDVILNFLYLQRNLWAPISKGLKIGGILLIECLTEDMLSIHPEINPTYLLRSAELQQEFINGNIGNNLEILYYSEGRYETQSSHSRATASLIARRIT